MAEECSNRREEEDFGPAPPEVHPKIANLRGRHRAAHPDTVSPLQVESHVLSVGEWPISCPRLLESLKIAGVHCLTKMCYLKLDHHLLTALVERWSPQTNTFHFAVGEMTITLEDVAMILGLQIDGPAIIGEPVVGGGRRWRSWPDCCDDLLGSHPNPDVVYTDPSNADVRVKFRMGQARSQTCVPLRWLRWTFQRESYADLNDIDFRRHVRAYILFLIGSFLLPDTSGNEVHLQYLPLLEDLEIFSRYSLGGAVLAHLYREMNEATKPKRSRIACCVYLLQLWSWEHLHVGRPTLHVQLPTAIFGNSVGVRWSCNWNREMPVCNLRIYRDELDSLIQSQIIWEPYTPIIRHHLAPICTAGSAIWLARVPLICWKRVEWYLPDRVLRQFGCMPTINVEPIEKIFTRVDGRGKADVDWSIYHYKYITLWDNRQSSIVSIIPAIDQTEKMTMLKRYMKWYKSWASLYLLKAPIEPPTTYYPRGTTERRLREAVNSAEQIFQPFYGREDASEYQLAINKFQELMIQTKKEMYLPDTTYHEDPEITVAGPSNIAESQIPVSYDPNISMGPSIFDYSNQQQQYGSGIQTEYEQWPSFQMNWTASSSSNPMPTPIPSIFPMSNLSVPDTTLNFDLQSNMQEMTYQNEPAHNIPMQDDVAPETSLNLNQRERRRPNKYTPGTDAIPKRKGRKK